MSDQRNPSPKEVQFIFRDIYNFYTKYLAVKEVNWSGFLNEVYALEKLYPFDLCHKMLLEIIDIVEAEKMKEGLDNGLRTIPLQCI